MESSCQYIQPNSSFSIIVPQDKKPTRIDLFLSQHFMGYSRTFFQKLIKDNCVSLNGAFVAKPSILIQPQDTVSVTFPLPQPLVPKIIDKPLDVSIVYEHQHFFIISKPANLVVHAPSHASTEITLVDWLISKCAELKDVGMPERPGIVHRLDKETSGLLIIPRTNYAHGIFSDLFKNRCIKKTYLAIVMGHPEKSGTIDTPIIRDPFKPNKMTSATGQGRSAITHYQVKEYFDQTTLVTLQPITGRTHQIRVHCASIGHPLLGDHLYGTTSKIIKRHALHAYSLNFEFEHQSFSFTQEPPADFITALNQLKNRI